MLILAYDTETTGFTKAGVESDDPGQPKIVEIGAILYDTEAQAEVRVLNTLLKLEDGLVIPEGAASVHGITTAKAMAEGRPHRSVIREFLTDFWKPCAYRICFNDTFDRKMVRIHLKTYKDEFSEAEADEWLTAPEMCMMRETTEICALPPTANMQKRFPEKKFKPPKLEEAVRILLKREHAGAHGALADARATLDLWKWMKAEGRLPEPRALVKKTEEDWEREAGARRRAEAHDNVAKPSSSEAPPSPSRREWKEPRAARIEDDGDF